MKKVLILGSCVSRDALEFAEPGEFELVAYFARTSFAALGGNPAPLPSGFKKLSAGWQQRMILADHDKSTLTMLKKMPFELLLIDLIDERFNLLELSNGTVVTLSVEYSSIADKPLPGRLIRSGSAEHVSLWRQGLQRLLNLLQAIGRKERVRVNRVFWANRDLQGREISGFSSDRIQAANDFLKDRYKDLEDAFGPEVFYSYSKDLLCADVGHKWGLSAFHYGDDFYRATVEHMRLEEKESRDAAKPLQSATWSVVLDAVDSSWTARIVDYSGDSSTEYAFYLMRGKERVAVRWYTPEPSMCFQKQITPGNYHVTGFVRTSSTASPEIQQSGIVTQEEVPLYDLQPWRKPVFDRAPANYWPEKNKLRDGIYRFAVEKDTLDILVDGIKYFQPGGVVLVCFGGAVTQRALKPAPFFSGIGVSAKLGMPVLAIADPSLALSASLALGWYAGNEKCPDLPQKIADLLDAFATLYQSRFVVFGGSGGGFATISILKYLRTRSAAVVWNPQTSIARYHAGAVKNYLDLAFPALREQKVLSIPDRLKFRGVVDDLVDVCSIQDHSLLYLQNQSDKFHVEQHARPFTAACRAMRVSDTVFAGDEGSIFWFGNWGVGHAVPPASMILTVLKKLISSQDVREIALQLENENPQKEGHEKQFQL